MPETLPRPRKPRHDGWTDARRAGFVAALAAKMSIGAAAASVGMSRRSAYRLRTRPDGVAVAAAWGIPTPATADATAARFQAVLDAADDALAARIAAAAAADPHRFGAWLIAELRGLRKRRFASTCVTFVPDARGAAPVPDVSA